MVCPLKCLEMVPRKLGVIRHGTAGRISFKQGLLNIGEPMAVPVIRELKKEIRPDGLALIDCPPGTGCPMIQSVSDSDYCLLVTEPTPFGRHDLELAHQVCDTLGIRHGVVVNKSSDRDGLIEDYCSSEGILIHGKVPYSRATAEACSRGELPAKTDEWMESEYSRILEGVLGCLQGSLSS